MGVPVGVRASLTHALANGRYDIVHGFEPGLPSLSYLALLHAESRSRRDLPLPRPARIPTAPRAAREAARPRRRAARHLARDRRGRARALSRRATASSPRASTPGSSYPARSATSWCSSGDPANGRTCARSSAGSRTGPAGSWCCSASLRARGPWCPAACKGRVTAKTAPTPAARAAVLNEASLFVPAPDGCGSSRPRGGRLGRRACRRAARARRRDAARRRASPRSPRSSTRCTRAWRGASAAARRPRIRSPTASGSRATCTCTRTGRTTARSPSPTCSTTRRRSGSARSPSPTTTSSAARARRSSSRVDAS